jgi:hypothetical protein
MIRNTHGHTLLIKCTCGCKRLIHCADRKTVEEEEYRTISCSNCEKDELMYVRLRGHYTLEEMEALLND